MIGVTRNLDRIAGEVLRDLPSETEATTRQLKRFFFLIGQGAPVREALNCPMSILTVVWLLLEAVRKEGLEFDAGSTSNGPEFLPAIGKRFTGFQGTHPLDSSHLISVDACRFSEQVDFVDSIIENRRIFKTEFFQNRESKESLIRRFKLMETFGDIEDRRIILLGDDALFSVFLAVSGSAREIRVLDIDPSLVELINDLSDEYNLTNLSATLHDVRRPIPSDISGCFDSFFASGYKDIGGLLLFIGRGLECLDERNETKSGFFVFGSHAFDRVALSDYLFKIQQWLTRFGCLTSALVPCVDTRVSNEFIFSILEIVLQNRLEKDDAVAWEKTKKMFSNLPSKFPDEGWLQVSEYPMVNLMPLPAARIAPTENLTGQLGRYLQMIERGGFTEKTDTIR